MMPPNQLRKKKISIVGFLNMWSFEGWGFARMKPMLKNLAPYFDYWDNIPKLLSKPLPTQSSTLLEGFQPSNN